MLARAIRECKDNWRRRRTASPDHHRHHPAKKVLSLIICCFSKKKHPIPPGDVALKVISGSTSAASAAISSSSPKELAVARAGAIRRRNIPKTVIGPKKMQKASISTSLFDKRSALDYIKSRFRKSEGSRRRISGTYDLIGRRGKMNPRKLLSRASIRATADGSNKTSWLGPLAVAEEVTGIRGRQRRKEETAKCRMELCKRRILMGRRCKPLNASGVLQYDGDGILVPEEMSPP